MQGRLSAFRMQFAIPMTFFFLFFGIGAIQPFVVPYLRNNLGMSALKASSIIGVLYLVFGIARFFTRYLIRLIEKRNTIILGAAGYLCLPISLSVGSSYAVYMLGAALMGMGAALVWTASSVQVLDTAEACHSERSEESRYATDETLRFAQGDRGEKSPRGAQGDRRQGKRYGAASGVMYFFVQAGISLGTIQGGLIASWSGAKGGAGNYLGIFKVSSLVGVLAILSAFLVPQVRSKFVDDRWSVAFRFFGKLSNLFPPAVLAISFCTYGIMLTMFNQYAATTFGPKWLTAFHTCYLLTGMATAYVGGGLSDRIGRTQVIALSLLAVTAGLAIFGLVKTAPLFILGATLVGCSGAIPTVALAWVGDNSTEAERPTVHACVFAWRDFGFVGVTYLGVLLQGQNLALQSCFLVFAGVFLASALLSGLLARHERA
jgi:MFS family permease